MKLTLKTGPTGRTDLLVLVHFAETKFSAPVGFTTVFAAAKDDLPEKFRQTLVLYPGKAAPAKRLLIIGGGKKEEFDTEKLRRLVALARNTAAGLEAKSLAFSWSLAGLGLDPFATGAALAEGPILASYAFTELKSKKEKAGSKKLPATMTIHLTGSAKALKAGRAGFAFGRAGATGQNEARHLADLPANQLNPVVFARAARGLARKNGFRCRVLDEKAMAKLGMHAFLGVARGSVNQPRMVILETKPTAKRKVCLVGKGLTFDSGGLSLKPSNSMADMRYDMCGAAAVYGLFAALEKAASLPFNVVGILGLAENMPGGNAQRPGDVVTAMDGTTIEVLNTDAEGRLVLADCIAYARKKIKPEVIINLATLTGACVVALGQEATGLFANHEGLAQALLAAGEVTRERCWQLPIWDEYKAIIKGKYGDIRNIGIPGKGANCIAAAVFLAHFAGDTPWAHLDIAGTADGSRSRDYYKQGAVGIGVRLLLQLLHQGDAPWLEGK